MVKRTTNTTAASSDHPLEESNEFDFATVRTNARIAVYDDFLSAPRVIVIEPAPTAQFIENISSKTYEYACSSGGRIPYTVIREVSENFIHARFESITVSIFDKGNTIRFTDQGPGIADKEKALLPGFTSAIEPMKSYIRGVGSGLPIVREYLSLSDGSISIDDNLESGSVITISLVPTEHRSNPEGQGVQGVSPVLSAPDLSQPPVHSLPSHFQETLSPWPQGASESSVFPAPGFVSPPSAFPVPGPSSAPMAFSAPAAAPRFPIPSSQGAFMPPAAPRPAVSLPLPPLSQREKDVLRLLASEGDMGVTEVSNITGIPVSSVHKSFAGLEQAGLVEKYNKKRRLSEWGEQVARYLS